MGEFSSKVITSINQVSQTQWQQLFPPHYPFTRYAFLAALEHSHCTSTENGWLAQHILIYHQDQLIAAMPCYLKTHSYGEYIFDWSWAEAYERHGLEYYPKLVCAIPFTPATGPRLGITKAFEPQQQNIIACIHQTLASQAEQINASNWQCLFNDKDLSDQLSNIGWMQRNNVQFHWFNRDYHSFDDFAATFASRKRKNLLKERNKVKQSDITIRRVEGDEITPAMWQKFYLFYQATYLKRSRHTGYLNQQFFTAIGETMPQQLMMVVAEDSQQHMVAAALYFKSNDTLYGRYWGCLETQQYLHFECCYYQGIEYCIEQQLAKFDAGAQGEHKIQRGFEPIETFANYHILHPQFGPAISDYIKQEWQHNLQYIEAAKNKLPFKKA